MIVERLNQVIDKVNDMQEYLDWDMRQRKLQENTQNSTNNVKNSHLFQGNEQKDHKIRSTNERWRRALDYAIDVIQTVAKMADKYSRYDSFEEQLKDIEAYCWQEGYILTHEEELNKAMAKRW